MSDDSPDGYSHLPRPDFDTNPFLPLLAPPANLPAPVDYSDFETQLAIKPKPIIEGLLESGSRMVFGGGSKTYKTWAMFDLAMSIGAGAMWWGFQCHKQPVLYCNFELKDFYARARLAEVRKAKNINLGDLKKFLTLWNLRDQNISNLYRPEFEKNLIQIINDYGIIVVFLDPFYKLLGDLDERITAELMPILALFEQICRDTGATIVTAAHYTKGNQAAKDPIDRISGGGGINRHPDLLAMLTKHETEGSFTIDLVARDFAPVDPFVVTWQYPLLVPDNGLDPKQLKSANSGRKFSEGELLKLIADNDNQLTVNALEKLAGEEIGMKPTSFGNYWRKIRNRGDAFLSKATGKVNLKAAVVEKYR